MDLTTSYMGIELCAPIVAGAAPPWAEAAAAKALEQAGVGAIVLPSLFEESVMRERLSPNNSLSGFAQRYARGLSHFPEEVGYGLEPEAYLDRIRELKDVVGVPIFGSINCASAAGWVRYAQRMERAGADGLELNIYYLAFDPEETSAHVEQRYVDILSYVLQEVNIPVAVKLSPFISAPLHLVRRLEWTGARAAVLFNRFYQPDFSIEDRTLHHSLQLSGPDELRLRLRWLAAMHGQVGLDLIATGGIGSRDDILKAVMAGARAVQLTSAILRHGPAYVGRLLDELREWLAAHGLESLDGIRGCMGLRPIEAPEAFERAEYARVLKSWQAEPSDS